MRFLLLPSILYSLRAFSPSFCESVWIITTFPICISIPFQELWAQLVPTYVIIKNGTKLKDFMNHRVIGFYIAIALFIIPLNREWLWFVSILGILLVVLLWSYGAEMVKAYLMGGLIISVILVTVVFVLWILYELYVKLKCRGSKQVFPQQGSDDKKRE